MGWFSLALTAMLFCGFKSLIAKRLLDVYQPSTFSFFDQLFTLAFLLPFLHFQNLKILDINFWILLSLIVLPNVVGLIFLSRATKSGQLSDVSPLLIFMPVLTALTSPIMQGEGLTQTAWIGIGIVGFGGYCLLLRNWRRPLVPFYNFFAEKTTRTLAVAILIGVWTSQLQRWLVQAYDPITALVFSTMGVVCFLALISLRQSGGVKPLVVEASHSWVWLVLLGVASALAGWSQLAAYGNGGDVAIVMSIKRLSVIFIAAYGIAFLKESWSLSKLIGISMMTFGVIVIYMA